jgi:hypothetical protein
MATYILDQIILSNKEIDAINNIIKIGCLCFKQLGYPFYYELFISHIYDIVKLVAIGATLAKPATNFKTFSDQLDILAAFMREASRRY